jgi:archaellum component FlaC
MNKDDNEREQPGVLDALMAPLRLPQRVVAEIETIATSVKRLSESAERRLGSVDDRAGQLVKGLGAMRASVTRIEGKVDQLMGLEETIEKRMEELRADLNERMLAVEQQVRLIQPPIEKMARDVAKIDQLLPDPSDGPLTRLKDTLTSS